MPRERHSTLFAIATVFAATLASATAFAADDYDFQQWAAPGSCPMTLSAVSQPNTLFDERDPQDVSDRVVNLLLSLHGKPTDLHALRLPALCDGLRLHLNQSPMPQPRAEPWNPNPAPERALQVSAMNLPKGNQFSQHLDVTYYPAAVYLSYTVMKTRPLGEERPRDNPLVYEDVGAHCPLRAGALQQRLLQAGYAQEIFGEEPPPAQYAFIEDGLSYVFTRDDRSIRVQLQGDVVEQRRDPASKCVALIKVSIEPEREGR
jgi:hypothetical protein